MTQTRLDPWPPTAPRWLQSNAKANAGAVTFAVGTALVLAALLFPDVMFPVDRVPLRIVNDTEYAFHISATDPDDDSLLALGIVDPRAELTLDDVIDQGAVWVFRFRGQGRAAGELTVSRHDLESHDWVLEIPDEAAQRLRDQGAPPNR